MPNWCLNTLTALGNDADLDALLDDARQDPVPATDAANSYPDVPAQSSSGPFSLEALLPTPPGLLEGRGWHDWRLEHWGTKWDLDDVRVERGPGRAVVACLSANAPFLAAVRAVSERHPALLLTLAYEEPGIGFEGEASFRAGECLGDWERETDDDEDWDKDTEEEGEA